LKGRGFSRAAKAAVECGFSRWGKWQGGCFGPIRHESRALRERTAEGGCPHIFDAATTEFELTADS